MSDRKVKCAITGCSYTLGKDYYAKKIVEYKSDEDLKKYFITRKAKTFLKKGYTILEIRTLLGVTDDELQDHESSEMVELVEYHNISSRIRDPKKITASKTFAMYKSDDDVVNLINNIRDNE
jgi:hypothetical protein|tara:strand:+ start:3760 stop:4125 length:366 start_codon:yes stop_codon:yes gene_type:complete